MTTPKMRMRRKTYNKSRIRLIKNLYWINRKVQILKVQLVKKRIFYRLKLWVPHLILAVTRYFQSELLISKSHQLGCTKKEVEKTKVE